MGPEKGDDSSTVLDNTIWFGAITDSQTGVLAGRENEWGRLLQHTGYAGQPAVLILALLLCTNVPALPCPGPRAPACAGIAIRAGAGCAAEACVLQGNLIRGRAIGGCGAAAGLTAAIGWFGGSPAPAWDANQVRR